LGYEKGSSGNLSGDGFSVRYDATSGFYIFDLPSTDPDRFAASNEGVTQWSGSLVDDSGGTQVTSFYVHKPTDLQLTYTTFAFDKDSWMAFGIPTATVGMPVTGTATYSAKLVGDAQGYYVAGTGSFSFDFGAGKLSGYLDPVLYDGWGTEFSAGKFDFVKTVYSTGSTAFSGQLANSFFATRGSFDGRFAGPAAEELMGRWQAPFTDPYSLDEGKMFGVFVGKK
jgi:hypothetical protein